MTFQRARRPEHKRQRYEAILTAARELATREGVRAVTLSDIAGAVGMHKSALLRYFETREEIFLRVAQADWEDWAAAMTGALAPLAPGSVAEVSAALARTLAERPLLCDVLTHAPLNLERNVSMDAVRAYKRAAHAATVEVMAAARRVLPELSEEDALDLVGATCMVAASLWQVTHPPPLLADLYEHEPGLEHATLEFEPTIVRLATTLILGIRART
ncbi:TetR/AcrR family transcriptional regulator [Actinophytocola gossypii]|uniref:TetR family transcriptional regulator n=1 Tax=Actinophytocola gossypii TaxID=2812003 RepID=A0ABT2JGE9_9PSEU|nr:TetR family transcriptional regulator [Actinophytocola gossypii]MCT2586947.1 TetR family transcriptional regulator [Actinophytocola gossypii]